MAESKKPLTPEEFARAMRDLIAQYKNDKEMMHVEMDWLMARQLESLGFIDGVTIFNNQDKWYA